MTLSPLAVAFVAICGMIRWTNGFAPTLPEPPEIYFRKLPSSSTSSDYKNSESRFPFSNPKFPSSILEACPKGFILAGERCLWINPSPLPWGSALNFCNQYGLRLLEIRSGNYYIDVVKTLSSQLGGEGSFWIGASKRLGSWGWNSKNINIPESFWAVTFINGKPVKEPTDDNKKCAFLDDSRWYFMNADFCDSYKQFICEKIPSEKPFFNDGVYFESEDGGEVSEGEEDASGPDCEEGWNGYSENCYRAMEERASFLEAQQICVSQNATLVSVSDTAENDWVAGLVPNATLIWIGLLRNDDSEFEWDDGTEFEYSNWHIREPDNVHHSEHCVHLEVTQGNHWRDEFCGNENRFVCEKTA